MVVTQFVPSSAAAPGEAGELVYYRPAEPTPVADDRGRRRHLVPEHRLPRRRDIRAARTGRAHEGADSRRQPVRARRAGELREVLRIRLGTGEGHHDADAGQPRPTVLGVRGLLRQAAELLVRPRSLAPDRARLDRTSPAATAFLDSDLAQNAGRRCILAYWHHPRFSSDVTHGNNASIGPLWTRLARPEPM